MTASNGVLKLTGTGVSAMDGSAQRIPWYTSVFNTSAWSVSLSGVNGVTLTSAGAYRIDGAIEVVPIADEETTFVLDVRKSGSLVTSAGFDVLDTQAVSFNRDEYGVIQKLTLKGSTIVSATAGTVVDLFLTGQPSSSATTQRLTINGPLG
jgi:hypothetical protein